MRKTSEWVRDYLEDEDVYPIGLSREENKENKIMNEELKNKLNTLCEEMASHVKYLRDETYHPYDKEEHFVYTLRDIIYQYSNN